MRWLLLAAAIGFETMATSCLKLSKGFTVLLPSVGTVVGYLLSFWCSPTHSNESISPLPMRSGARVAFCW